MKRFLANFSCSFLGASTSLIRNPKVTIDGEINFASAYALWKNENLLRTTGNNLQIRGHTEFEIVFSDYYNGANNFDFKGSFIQIPSLYQWDESGTLGIILFLFLSPQQLRVCLFFVFQSNPKENVKTLNNLGCLIVFKNTSFSQLFDIFV